MRCSVFLILALTVFSSCKKQSQFEFCFSTEVNGMVSVFDAKIGDVNTPCGILSAHGERGHGNEKINFRQLRDLDICGASSCCYSMEHPDSAYLRWSTLKNGEKRSVGWKKSLKLPPFPPRKWNEMYRVSFAIAYEDCVYVKIETVPK